MKTPEDWIKYLDDNSSYKTGLVVITAKDVKLIQEDAIEKYKIKLEITKNNLTKMAGHKHMQVAQPARELLNLLKL